MHFQSLILLALSAGALSMPSSLSPRKHDSHPSIAPYKDGICTQQAGPSQDFNQNSQACVKIAYTEDNVGINWGDWPESMNSFDVFTDDNCKDYAWKTITNPGLGNDPSGANACYSMKLHGGPWKSVMQHYNQVE